jgi:hypothetical protein
MNVTRMLQSVISDGCEEHQKPGVRALNWCACILEQHRTNPDDEESLKSLIRLTIEHVTDHSVETVVNDLLDEGQIEHPPPITPERRRAIARLKKRLFDDANEELSTFQSEMREGLFAIVTNNPRVRICNPELFREELSSYKVGIMMAVFCDLETDSLMAIRKRLLTDYPVLASR